MSDNVSIIREIDTSSITFLLVKYAATGAALQGQVAVGYNWPQRAA
jgi:hypothetical protein